MKVVIMHFLYQVGMLIGGELSALILAKEDIVAQ
jgi:hypothetical protein